MYYIISPSEKSKKHPPGCHVNIQGSLISSAECRRRAPGQRAWPRKPVRVKRTQQGQLPAFLGCCAGDSISAVVSSIRSTWRQATKIHFLLSLSHPCYNLSLHPTARDYCPFSQFSGCPPHQFLFDAFCAICKN